MLRKNQVGAITFVLILMNLNMNPGWGQPRASASQSLLTRGIVR
jgi:hypothetical protein